VERHYSLFNRTVDGKPFLIQGRPRPMGMRQQSERYVFAVGSTIHIWQSNFVADSVESFGRPIGRSTYLNLGAHSAVPSKTGSKVPFLGDRTMGLQYY
jgi:hypothetical protein